jgi:hypothetical protein
MAIPGLSRVLQGNPVPGAVPPPQPAMATAVLISSQSRKKERQQRHSIGLPVMYVNCAILALATAPLYLALPPFTWQCGRNDRCTKL